ncbi:Chloroperoxidase [Desarmillaria tabescens]|uniref:Chloroperoxidase n=1 Tax=Armillaria tabescens TaxID=1929756 RepID=A0AA39NC26_ARMTA|nr:Chloroperoxidase [Desarmillaria tabescens]KAK0462860.1 Chloroperoxidase [Desarmillaria tabescens]
MSISSSRSSRIAAESSKVLDHAYIAAASSSRCRAPCPALNALANHGYISRDGQGIAFFDLIRALVHVYNLSIPLALLLALPGYLLSGTFHFKGWPWQWTWVLSLAALSDFGASKLAHRASLVHVNHPSHCPDSELLDALLSVSPSGLSIRDFAMVRVKREAALDKPMNWWHEQVALGESGLSWLLFRDGSDGTATVPVERLRQFFGQERLPDGWWEHVRPQQPIGLLAARRVANEVQKDMTVIRGTESD